mmetsp:Transcript_5985/g.12603  ORF Transcript_5985/g.12603 Transcript_5985/m.12603 type:complete len:265 (+) Transcript_5985:2230-3024(+)
MSPLEVTEVSSLPDEAALGWSDSRDFSSSALLSISSSTFSTCPSLPPGWWTASSSLPSSRRGGGFLSTSTASSLSSCSESWRSGTVSSSREGTCWFLSTAPLSADGEVFSSASTASFFPSPATGSPRDSVSAATASSSTPRSTALAIDCVLVSFTVLPAGLLLLTDRILAPGCFFFHFAIASLYWSERIAASFRYFSRITSGASFHVFESIFERSEFVANGFWRFKAFRLLLLKAKKADIGLFGASESSESYSKRGSGSSCSAA